MIYYSSINIIDLFTPKLIVTWLKLAW